VACAELGSNWHVGTKDRVITLREALKLSQDDLARRADPTWIRVNISKIETGRNKLSTVDAREKLARGFGLTVQDLTAYLDGRIDVDEARRRAQSIPPPSEGPRVERDPTPPFDPADAVSPLEAALSHAFDGTRHLVRDLDAVRAVLRNSFQMQASDTDLVEAARRWLDGAAQLRAEGVAVTVGNLVFRVTVGRKPSAHDRATAERTDVEAETRQRSEAKEEGVEWGSKRHVLQKPKRGGKGAP
jgi:transcriptional regulator with XRE-family HTH domain